MSVRSEWKRHRQSGTPIVRADGSGWIPPKPASRWTKQHWRRERSPVMRRAFARSRCAPKGSILWWVCCDTPPWRSTGIFCGAGVFTDLAAQFSKEGTK